VKKKVSAFMCSFTEYSGFASSAGGA
jgi:hypothetical protein